MRTLSLDRRERILAACDNHEGTREEIAQRFRVSLGMVKKLLQQRRRIGDIAPQHHRAGRKPTILPIHRQRFRTLLAKRNDFTLKELREAAGLQCSLQAIHLVLGKMGLTYKKGLSAPTNKSDQSWCGPAGPGSGARRASIRRA